MITQETAARIWNAHREIQTGIKLLEDVAKERERHIHPVDERAPTIRDAFGHRQYFQLGVPFGENGHRLFEVSPVLAESCIRAHIENKRRDLAEANEVARIELLSNEASANSQEERQ
jgi:hypothetical protein